MSKSQVVTARIDEATAVQLDQLAERLDRSRSWLVKRAVTTMINAEAELHAFIQEGVDAADRGDVISQEEMEAWFEQRTGRDQAAAE